MGQLGESSQGNQGPSKSGDNALQRTVSRSSNAGAGGSKPPQSPSASSGNFNRDRRGSLAQNRMGAAEGTDVGIETIEQMLQRSAQSSSKQGAGFVADGHNGFFSLPLPEKDMAEESNPLFTPEAVAAARRSSGGKIPDSSSDISPGETIGRTSALPIPQQQQPQASSSKSPDKPAPEAEEKPTVSSTDTRDGPVKQPKPRSANTADKLDIMANSTDPDATHDVQEAEHGATYLQGDNAPDDELIRPIDLGGIIRLSQAGSLGSVGDSSAKSRNSKGSKDSTSLSAQLRGVASQSSAASQQTKSNVQNYLAGQANTINHPDPNAPTPSPAPSGDDDEDDERPSYSRNDGDWSSEASMSVRDSSEMATASGEDLDVEDVTNGSIDEPIVTFRFEHVSTEDGHHVVVGREGQLQKCEDEVRCLPKLLTR